MKRTTLTSIELFVIIAIVILLPAVITASLGTARRLAKIPICANNLRQIGIAVYEYAQIYDGNMPNVLNWYGDEEAHPYVAYRGDKPEHFVYLDMSANGKMIPYRLACLYEAGLIKDARVFYCPANTDPARMFESYNNPSPWGTLPQKYNVDSGSIQWVRCGHEWFPVDRNPNPKGHPFGGRPRAPINVCRRFDNLDPNLPYCTDFMRIRDSMSHNYDEFVGLNLLYSDGHVFFQDDPDIFSDRLWDFDPSGQTAEEIMAIYYQRILALSGQNSWPH